MSAPGGIVVALRPWASGDLWLLERLLGDEESMRHLGGPESPQAIRDRHRRYLAPAGTPQALFAIQVGPERASAGWVGYWESESAGETVWECGWHVLPEFQERGVATMATSLVLADARERHLHRAVHAFPSVDNTASNALCRALGFTMLGEADVEYPKGHTMRSNDWCLDLESGLPG
jgi:RimJ/RimL family protein N-acetyltransferase